MIRVSGQVNKTKNFPMKDNTLESPGPARSSNVACFGRPVLLILFIIFSYWIYGYRPIASYPDSAVDDGLYLRHARAFIDWLSGLNPRWLGDYDCFLLSKAPLYGLFLAVLNLLSIPVRIGEFILLLGVSFFFVAACRPWIQLRGWRFFVPVCLLTWLPLLPSETHLLRNALQSILTSYLLIAAIGLTLRWRSALREQVRWAALLGLLFSLSYLNREEAAWISIVVLFSLSLFWLLTKLNGCFRWRRAVTVVLVTGLCAIPPILLVCALNYHSYGVFLTTIRRSSAFTSAYQRLTSLEPQFHKRYVPICRVTRFHAYDLSPTYAKLKPLMEGTASYWVAGIDDHSALNGYSQADKEFFVSNYEFALEYSAYCAGARTAAEAEHFFASIEHELTAAVRAGRIRAGMHGPAILAAPQPGDTKRIFKAWWESFRSLLVLKRAGIDWSDRSKGTAASLEQVSLFVHSSLTPENPAGIDFKLRFRVVGCINQVLRVVYWSTIPLLLVFSTLTFTRDRVIFFQTAVVATIPLLAVALFCLAMAVVDTLGFSFLSWMGYNVLGYSPFSVLSASTFVLVLAHSSRSKTESVTIAA